MPVSQKVWSDLLALASANLRSKAKAVFHRKIDLSKNVEVPGWRTRWKFRMHLEGLATILQKGKTNRLRNSIISAQAQRRLDLLSNAVKAPEALQ